MAVLLALGAFGLSLWYYTTEDERLFQAYKKVREERGPEFPVQFSRPPKQIWQDPSDLICQPGMPEGEYSELPIVGSFSDRGVFGAPKVNIMKDNVYYPLYRTECLYL